MNRTALIVDLMTGSHLCRHKFPNSTVDYCKLVKLFTDSNHTILRKIAIGKSPAPAFINFLEAAGYEIQLNANNIELNMALLVAEIIQNDAADTIAIMSDCPEVYRILQYAHRMGKCTSIVCSTAMPIFQRNTDNIVLIDNDILMTKTLGA